MTDGEFLEQIRKERGLSQEQMAALLGMKGQSNYSYYTQQKKFKEVTKNEFKRKLKIRKWNEAPTDLEIQIDVLKNRLIKLEHEITGKSVKKIKEEIENELELNK